MLPGFTLRLISASKARDAKMSRDCPARARDCVDNKIFRVLTTSKYSHCFKPFFKRHGCFALSWEVCCNIGNLLYQIRDILAGLKVSFLGLFRLAVSSFILIRFLLKFVSDCVFTSVNTFKRIVKWVFFFTFKKSGLLCS